MKAPVSSATADKLIVSVPLGATYYPVTVTANKLTTFSSAPFDVTFSGGGTFDFSSLSPQVNLVTGSTPTGMNLVDLDGDGKPDLIVADWGAASISVFRNISTNGALSTGSFAPRVDFAVGGNPYFMAVADLDGDGKPDLVVANSSSGSLSIFRNVSNPGSFTTNSFRPRVDISVTTSAGPYQVAIADLDGDGLPDLVVANGNGTTVSVLRNLGGGGISASTFAPGVDFAAGSSPSWVAIGDLDGDGKPDLAVAGGGGTLSILKNTSSRGNISSGSFAAPVSWTVGGRPLCAAIGDLDGDGKPDIVVGNYGYGTTLGIPVVSIFHNTSGVGILDTNSFAAPFSLAEASGSQNVALADLDGDGRADLVVASLGGVVSVFHNVGTNGVLAPGSFAPRVNFTAQSNPLSVVIGDLDGDGKPDVVAANDFSSTLSIFRNTTVSANTNGPVILTQPQSTNMQGGTATLTVVASGQSPLSYQWFIAPGTPIEGATNASWQVIDAAPGSYWVVVSNAFGSVVSATAVVTVGFPQITSQPPPSQSVGVGNTAVFAVLAEGASILSYQWQFDGTNISGATSGLLVLNDVHTTDAGTYDVIVSNYLGEVQSSDALLTIANSKLQVASTSASGGTTLTVPINLLSEGDENAAGFSIDFDVSLLTYSGVAVGTGASAAVLVVNSNHAPNGIVGFELALPSGTTFSAGTQQLVQLTFQAAFITNAVTTEIYFGDQPIPRQISDADADSLPAMFLSGSVAVAAAQLEGDVSPRPNGDGVVNIFDWVQEGRFVARLDTISNANEFQRIDCAPRATLGDGEINVADWVQVGRYAAGLDPVTVAGGPPGMVELPLGGPRGGPSTLVAFGAASHSAGENSVAVDLMAQGGENALSFSVNFDPKAMTFVSASPGGGAAGALLSVNSNFVSSGQLGCAIALSPGNAFAAGAQEIVTLHFTSGSYSNNAALMFGNSPVSQGLADANANPLIARFQDGTLPVAGSAWPQLNSEQTGNGLALSWPASASGFNVETASALDGLWSVVAGTPVASGDTVTLTVPLSPATAFYRLHHQ